MNTTFKQLLKATVRGYRAITMQTYTEANIKNGVQYYARRAWANSNESGSSFSSGNVTASASNTRYLYFETGSKPVIVKDRITKHIGEEFTLTIYSTPTIGTFGNEIPITISNYRSDGGAVPTTIAKVAEIPFNDVSSAGTAIDTPEHFFGSTSTGQSQSSTLAADRERIIPANSSFLVGVHMTSGASGRFEYFLDWYEGGTDLPRKEFN